MTMTMTTLARLLALLLILPAAALAQSAASPDDPIAEYLWEKRPLIIFADSDRDPRLKQQLEALEREAEELAARDVVIIVDTDPGKSRSEASPLRRKFRPHGFNVLLVGKDGSVKMRNPDVVTAFDVMRMVDRLPLRQEELGRR